MPSTQEPLIRVMENFGYKSERRGICAGFVAMYAFAEMCGNTQAVEDRVKFITELANNKNIKDMISGMRTKVKAHDKLSASDQKILELDAFFAGIEMAHNTDSYKDFFSEFVAKADIEKLAGVIGPAELLKMGGVEKVYSEPVIEDAKHLNKFMNSLGKILAEYMAAAKDDERAKLSISLYSINHRIRIGYSPTDHSWILTDPNQLPSKKISDDDIGAEIVKAFHDKKLTAFDCQIFSTAKNPYLQNIKGSLAEFKQSHPINSATLKKVTDKVVFESSGREILHGCVRITHIAAMNNDVEVLKKAAKLDKKILLKEDVDGYTPIMLAAQYGYAEAVKFLASIDEKSLFHVTSIGLSAIGIAIQKNHIEVIEALAENKKFLAANPDLLSGVAFSVIKNPNVSMLVALGKIDSGFLFARDSEGYTLAHVALHMGNLKHMEVLAEHKVDFTAKNKSGYSALSAAIRGDRWDMVVVMLLSMKNVPEECANIKREKLKEGVVSYLNTLSDQGRIVGIIDSLQLRDNGLAIVFADKKSNSITGNSSTMFASKNSSNSFVADLKKKFMPAVTELTVSKPAKR